VAFLGNEATLHTNTILRKCAGFDLGNWWKWYIRHVYRNYLHVCVCLCVCIYIYIYIYTHTYTYSLTSTYLLVVGVVYGYTWLHSMRHTRQDSSGRGIGPSQRSLPVQYTTFKRDRRPCCRRDSNPQTHASDNNKELLICNAPITDTFSDEINN
jgi:hypothetical protein